MALLIIYRATNLINGKCYVGQTAKSLEVRKQGHYDLHKRGEGFKFHEALRSYGWDSFDWEVIDTASSLDEMNEKEVYWIEKLNSLEDGYNLTSGGEVNGMYCEATASKHLASMRSEGVRSKISISMKKLRQEEEFNSQHRQRISNAMQGNKNGVGNQARMGDKLTEEHKQKLFASRSKVVEQLDLAGNLLGKFSSLTKAGEWARLNGIGNTVESAAWTISQTAKVEGKAFGYIWRLVGR